MKDYDQHIESYIRGQLTGEELAQFENAMAQDSSLRDEVEKQRLAMEISLGFLEEEVRGVLEGNTSEENVQSSKSMPLYRRLSIAASVLILIGTIAYWYGKPKSHWDYDRVYAEVSLSQERGDFDTLIYAVNLGRKGEMVQAKRTIQGLDTIQRIKDYWIAELHAGVAEGDSILKYLPSSDVNDPVERDRLLYLEILAHIAKKDFEKVRQLKDQLPEDFADYYWGLLD